MDIYISISENFIEVDNSFELVYNVLTGAKTDAGV